MTRRLLAFLLAVLVVAGPGPAAVADVAALDDAVGDVEGSRYPDFGPDNPDGCAEPEPVDGSHRTDLDLTGLRVDHRRRDLVVTVRFADLVPGREQYVEVHLLTPRYDYDVSLAVDRRGRVLADWLPGYQTKMARAWKRAQREGSCAFLVSAGARNCDGLDVDRSTGTDRVRVVVPRRCFDATRTVRVGASAHGWEDDAVFSDTWGGEPRPGVVTPVYGPGVRAAC